MASAIRSDLAAANDREVTDLSGKEIAVRTHAYEAQSLLIRKFVNQQQIRLQVTFAMAYPIAAQAMIATPFRKRLVGCKQTGNLTQQRLDVRVPRRCLDALVVALKC